MNKLRNARSDFSSLLYIWQIFNWFWRPRKCQPTQRLFFFFFLIFAVGLKVNMRNPLCRSQGWRADPEVTLETWIAWKPNTEIALWGKHRSLCDCFLQWLIHQECPRHGSEVATKKRNNHIISFLISYSFRLCFYKHPYVTTLRLSALLNKGREILDCQSEEIEWQKINSN